MVWKNKKKKKKSEFTYNPLILCCNFSKNSLLRKMSLFWWTWFHRGKSPYPIYKYLKAET